VPKEQTAAKGNLLAPALCNSRPICGVVSFHLMTGALHLLGTAAAQAIKEDDFTNTEHRSFVCSFSYWLLSFLVWVLFFF